MLPHSDIIYSVAFALRSGRLTQLTEILSKHPCVPCGQWHHLSCPLASTHDLTTRLHWWPNLHWVFPPLFALTSWQQVLKPYLQSWVSRIEDMCFLCGKIRSYQVWRWFLEHVAGCVCLPALTNLTKINQDVETRDWDSEAIFLWCLVGYRYNNIKCAQVCLCKSLSSVWHSFLSSL